jgi:hypothetical protein
MNKISSAFISYHHNDRIIGDVIHDVLFALAGLGKGKSQLACFLDAKDIKQGEFWQKVIDDNLSSKDWLIVVFTGEQSVYCGYEIGTFSQKNLVELNTDKAVKRLMSLYDVEPDRIPIVLRPHQNTQVDGVNPVVDPKNVVVAADEINKWYSSPVGTFLQEFCDYKELYTPDDARDDPSAYKNAIAWGAKSIANAFALAQGEDIKDETPAQIGFELMIRGAGDKGHDKIPGDSIVEGTTLFFNILGLQFALNRNQAPSTTWAVLNEKLKAVRSNIPWLHKVETDVLRAIQSLTPSGDDVTFRAENGKIYSPILVRHRLYVNGDRRFVLLVVETLDRRFAGSQTSSLLLTALILASRWRFSYFEKWTDTVELIFGDATTIQNFTAACKQLVYNIEWIEHESAELGVSDPKLLIGAFGDQRRARVERFFEDWEKAKNYLFASLPPLDIEISAANRASIRKAIIVFLSATREQNADFLELALQAYTEQIKSDLRKERNDDKE